MYRRSSAAGAVVLAAGLGAVLLAGPASAAPSTVPASAVPSPTCKVPSLTVSPATGPVGTVVTVTGSNFSGCKLKTGTIAPTAVIPVKVGLLDLTTKKSVVLSTVSTSSAGSFTTSITIPSVSTTGGVAPKLEVAAASVDPATKLDYAAVLPFTLTGTSGTSVPTAVPAGLGSSAATTSESTRDMQLGLGLGGLAVAGAAGAGLARRRRGTHR